jgi:hypothetical protein
MSQIKITSQITLSDLEIIVSDLHDLAKFISNVDNIVNDQVVTNEVIISLLESSLKACERDNSYYFNRQIEYTFEVKNPLNLNFTAKLAELEKQIKILKLMLKLMYKFSK